MDLTAISARSPLWTPSRDWEPADSVFSLFMFLSSASPGSLLFQGQEQVNERSRVVYKWEGRAFYLVAPTTRPSVRSVVLYEGHYVSGNFAGSCFPRNFSFIPHI